MSETETFPTFEWVLKEVVKIWTPGVEAIRLQSEMDVHSVEQMPAALERAGYEVYEADLPFRVSGCAAVVDGRRYILVNRSKSRREQQFTLSHELGHHVLHLTPSPVVETIGFAAGTDLEFQADQFATLWLMWGSQPEEREAVLRRNPRARMVLTASVMSTILIVVAGLLFYIGSRLLNKKPARENR